jgi:hypothetical protein
MQVVDFFHKFVRFNSLMTNSIRPRALQVLMLVNQSGEVCQDFPAFFKNYRRTCVS